LLPRKATLSYKTYKMARLKPLRPTLKEKKRYVVFEVISVKALEPKELFDAINKQCLEFMGTLHFGKAGILILKNQLSKDQGVIRVNHKYVDFLRASLMLINEINKKKVNINVKGVSGILKKAREKFMIKN